MKAFRQLALVLAVCLPLIAPAMACVLPGAPLSPAEQACCKQMKMQCGDSGMPASHGCCHKDLPASGYLSVVPATSAQQRVIAHAVVPGALPIIMLHAAVAAHGPAPPHREVLPHSPPAAISVLRI